MNPIAKTLNRHKKANQEIQASTANFSRIYRDARMEINDMLRRHVLGRRNPLEGKHLVELIENLSNQYGEMEAAFREEFRRAIPYVAESYFFDCLHDLGKQAAGEVDQDRIELMMQDAFSHVAGATNNMFKSDVSFLREASATVFREASVTGKTRKKVSGELLGRLMARPEQFRFIDAKGRVWNNETYVEMLGRTVLLNAGRQTYFDTCIDNGKDVVRVTVSGDPCPNCAVWENRLLSITGQTQGLPTVQEAQQAGLLHPNCTHSFIAVGRYVQKNDFGSDGRPNSGLNSPGKEERNDKEAWREYREEQTIELRSPVYSEEPQKNGGVIHRLTVGGREIPEDTPGDLQVLYKEAEKDVAKAMELIKDSRIEYSISLTKNRNVTELTKGTAAMTEQIIPKGGISIHNHPDGSTFSPSDVIAALKRDATEMVVVTKDHTFTLRKRESAHPISEKIFRERLEKAASKEYDISDLLERQNKIWQEVFEGTQYEYEIR